MRRLALSLYPPGRAFRARQGGVLDRLHEALAQSQAEAFTGALSTLDSAIADNPNFTADDATDWERRLGLVNAPGVPLADRIQAINQKLNYPGTDAPRQHYKFIEQELQAAGFNVVLTENNFGGSTKTPEEYFGLPASGAFYSSGIYYGGTSYGGGGYSKIIANHIEEDPDASFVVGGNLRSTFFISGPAGVSADVLLARKAEFRQLVLSLKPVQAIAYLNINYT